GSRLKCPKCGSREIRVLLEPPTCPLRRSMYRSRAKEPPATLRRQKSTDTPRCPQGKGAFRESGPLLIDSISSVSPVGSATKKNASGAQLIVHRSPQTPSEYRTSPNRDLFAVPAH